MTATQSAVEHVAAVGELYAAFGRGDVETILGALAPDVSWDGDWADHFGQRGGLGLMVPRHGRDGVREFFGIVATLQVHDFQVLDLLASDAQVVAQIVIEASYPDGGRYRDEELHLWTFDPAGRVTALRHYVDTAKHLAAAAGADTTRRP